MNVRTLIELLEQMDPNATVQIETEYDQIDLEWDMVTPATHNGQELVVFCQTYVVEPLSDSYEVDPDQRRADERYGSLDI